MLVFFKKRTFTLLLTPTVEHVQAHALLNIPDADGHIKCPAACNVALALTEVRERCMYEKRRNQ